MSDDEGGFGLGDLMPRSPSPEPAPFSYSTYTLPEGFTLPSGSNEVVIRLVGSHPLWGHHLWNTSLTCTSYLLSLPIISNPSTRVLELGAGGALPSIACAAAGSQVVSTDYADASLLSNITYNAETNLGPNSSCTVKGHTWGQDVTPLLQDGKFDIIILSDLVFNHSQHKALIKTVDECLSPNGEAFVFFTHHRPHFAKEDMEFLPKLGKRGFKWERVAEEYRGPMFKEDPGDEKVRGTVHGFRFWREGEREMEEESD